MRFVEFLKTTVLLSGGAATMLGIVTVLGASREDDGSLVFVAAGWWFGAAAIGTFIGRRVAVSTAIGGLLADARAATTMPQHRPARVLINRLWPLAVTAIAAAGLAAISAKIPAVATGFAIIWALSWRNQSRAVQAIEERDGAAFYVEPTSPIHAMKLVRTPGMRRERPSVNGNEAA